MVIPHSARPARADGYQHPQITLISKIRVTSRFPQFPDNDQQSVKSVDDPARSLRLRVRAKFHVSPRLGLTTMGRGRGPMAALLRSWAIELRRFAAGGGESAAGILGSHALFVNLGGPCPHNWPCFAGGDRTRSFEKVSGKNGQASSSCRKTTARPVSACLVFGHHDLNVAWLCHWELCA
jgi:hypothetical protein